MSALVLSSLPASALPVTPTLSAVMPDTAMAMLSTATISSTPPDNKHPYRRRSSKPEVIMTASPSPARLRYTTSSSSQSATSRQSTMSPAQNTRSRSATIRPRRSTGGKPYAQPSTPSATSPLTPILASSAAAAQLVQLSTSTTASTLSGSESESEAEVGQSSQSEGSTPLMLPTPSSPIAIPLMKPVAIGSPAPAIPARHHITSPAITRTAQIIPAASASLSATPTVRHNHHSNVADASSPIASVSQQSVNGKKSQSRIAAIKVIHTAVQQHSAAPTTQPPHSAEESHTPVLFSPLYPHQQLQHAQPTTLQPSYTVADMRQAHQYNEDDEFDPFVFVRHLPPLHTIIRSTCPPLPSKSPSAPLLTLALDLDETLVHCSITPLEVYDTTFDVEFSGVKYTVYLRLRPHMQHFLQQVSQWYEIVLFTASQQVYADKLLNLIDPHRQYIHHRIFREHCVLVEGNYLKDLTVLGRDPRHTMLVDNSIQAFGYQIDQGIPIESFFDDVNDTELLKLLPFLFALKDVQDDVRPHVRQAFQLQRIIDSIPYMY